MANRKPYPWLFYSSHNPATTFHAHRYTLSTNYSYHSGYVSSFSLSFRSSKKA